MPHDPANALASLVLTNGKVVTMNAWSTIARAVAIGGDTILAVGSEDDARRHIGPETRVIDLGGRTVIPGLIDGHAHMDREGLKEALPSMAGVRSIADIQERIAALARQRRPGEWIVTMPLGDPPEFGGMPGLLRENRYPTREDLDRAAPDNPVFIKPAWGYWTYALPTVSIANSRALALAGVTRQTQSPAASLQIDRDPTNGEPTGQFIEANVMPIVEFTLMAAAPSFDVDMRTDALVRAMQIYNRLGTTSVFEGHGVADDVVTAYRRVHESGRQTVRATLMFSPAWKSVTDPDLIRTMIASWAQWLARKGTGDDWLRLQGCFTEIDKTPEVALRAQGYPQTGWSGFHYDAALPREAVKVLLSEAARNGIRVCGIAPAMIDLFAEVARETPIAGQRWIHCHVSTLDDRQIALIRDLGLCVTTHTNGYIYRGGAALLNRVGPQRENEIVPLRRLLDAGVPVALATDNVPPTLWYPIWQAVARRDRASDEPIAPAQALSREDALRCATMGGAYLTFDEETKGSLEPGKLADLVVPSQDPLTCDLDALRDTVADLTIVNGEIVFDRSAV